MHIINTLGFLPMHLMFEMYGDEWVDGYLDINEALIDYWQKWGGF